jgi:hypothetical protein
MSAVAGWIVRGSDGFPVEIVRLGGGLGGVEVPARHELGGAPTLGALEPGNPTPVRDQAQAEAPPLWIVEPA